MSEDSMGDDELKTARFNMFMSPNEMAAIEEWAWKNRIRSKSEAVRRLCQIGMDMHFQAVLNGRRAWELSEKVMELTKTAESEEEAAFYSEIFGVLIDVAVSSGRALRFGGKEGLNKLLQNDAEFRRLIEEDEAQGEGE